MDLNNLTVVLLAGDRKCLNLIPSGRGESYLERALEELRPLSCPIILVHHPDVHPPVPMRMMTMVPAGEKLFESVAAGLTACTTDFILLLASDLPLVTTAAIREFYLAAKLGAAEVSIALADLAACEALGRTTSHPIPLAGRKYKFGNAFVFRREARERILATIRDLLGLRKEPSRLVWRFLSLRFLVSIARFALSSRFPLVALRFDEAEQLIARQVGIRTRGIVSSPFLAIDND